MRLAFSTLLLALLISTGYAQNNPPNNEARAEMMASVDKLLTKAERSINNPDKLNDILFEYSDSPPRVYLTKEDRREIAKRLIKIFYAIDESLTSMANKSRIMEIVGASDDSPEAHKFFLDVLNIDNEEYRKMALWGIRPTGLHGDDLYEKIRSLERDGKITKIRSLQCMTRANPKRALEEMKVILKTTKSVKEFVRVGINLPYPSGDAPEVLDIIIDRYHDFKGKAASAEEEGYTPERAMASQTLWPYIDIREGARLKTALEIIDDKGVCGQKDLPVLRKKLKSADSVTRAATADFLGKQVSKGNLRKEVALPVLEEAYGRETDQKVKQKIKVLRERLGAK